MNVATETTPDVCPKCKGKGGWETGPHSESCHLCDGTGQIKPTPDAGADLAGRILTRYYNHGTSDTMLLNEIIGVVKSVDALRSELAAVKAELDNAMKLIKNEKACGDFWVQASIQADSDLAAARQKGG